MGLERIAAIKKGTLSNYDTDVFEPLLQQIEAWRGGSTPDD
jgi:alanyl-tRNA synthetase